MYYAHFGLKEPPFKITPNTDFFFPGGNRGAVLEALRYAILHGEGIVKVVGEVGSGKTMLCRMLQEQLPEQVDSVYLANPSVAPEDVLHAIAQELHLEISPEAGRLEVMQRLQQLLVEKHEAKRRVVVFVEEAQGMPLATLEEIRLLTNLETRYDKLLQIVLFGQPELDDNLAVREIRQLKERITHSFYLGPLKPEEVADYLMFRLRAAGYFGPPLFTPRAIRSLARQAHGLVRRVNILADKSLLAAFAANTYQVTPKHVRAAIRDSEFSTTPAPAPIYSWLMLLIVGLGLMGGGVWWYLQPQITGQAAQSPALQGFTPPVAENPSMMSVIEQRRAGASDWLAAQNEASISLELLRSKDLAAVQTLLQTQALVLDDVHVLENKLGAEPLVLVLYGVFEHKEQALSELQRLPAELQQGAHLRTVAGIRQELTQNQ